MRGKLLQLHISWQLWPLWPLNLQLQLFLLLFILKSLYNGQNREFLKNPNWNMPETPRKMHLYDMMKIDKVIFEIVGGGGF